MSEAALKIIVDIIFVAIYIIVIIMDMELPDSSRLKDKGCFIIGIFLVAISSAVGRLCGGR